MKIRHLAIGLVLWCGSASFQRAHAREPREETAKEMPALEFLGEEGAKAIARLYDYDPSIPLEARVVERVKKDGFLREKVVFRGVQGFLVPGIMQTPEGEGKRPCVLLLHGWSGSKDAWWQDGNYISGGEMRKSLLASGFAILALDAQCHGDRIAVNDYAPVNHYVDPVDPARPPRKGYFTQVEIYMQTTRDYRRAIDYLETRPDIDKSRIGAVGYSMGGTQTFLLTGVEPRIKAACAIAAPADNSKWSPIAPQNFARGIASRPFLTIIGRSDELCPLARAKAVHALIPSPTKDQVLFDAGHRLPAAYVSHALQWMRKHL